MLNRFFCSRHLVKGLFLAILALAVSGSPVLAGDDDDDFIDLCGKGTPAAVRAAIEAGANVNARDDDGETALMRAAEKSSNPEVVAILLRAGANVNARDDDGETALEKARERGSSGAAIVKLLLKAGAKE